MFFDDRIAFGPPANYGPTLTTSEGTFDPKNP